MKLLYIHQYFKFPDQTGGTRSYDLSTSFVRQGVEVIVITSCSDGSTAKKGWSVVEREGLKLYILNCRYNNSMSFYRRIYSFLYFMFKASFKALRIKCDLVLATSTPLSIAVPAMLKRLLCGTPYVFEVRDVWPEVPIRMGYIRNNLVCKVLRWFERRVYKRAKWVVPLSDGMQTNITSRIKGLESKMTVIPNISEISRFQSTAAAESDASATRELVYAGTMGDVNGISYLVDLAYYTLQLDPTLIYSVYGGGKQTQQIADYAQQRGVLRVNFYMRGSVSKSDLPAIYRGSTFGSSFVIDNEVLWDNSANKFFDTLAAGRPVVINHRGWQADVIGEFNVGYVLPAVIDSASASEFAQYTNNAARIKEQGQNALSLAKERYSLEVATQKYMEIFRRILG